MTFNLIEKNMIAFNKVEMHPDFLYIFASDNCNSLELLDIDHFSSEITAGVYGGQKLSNIKIKKDRVYNVNSTFINDDRNTIDKITSAKSDLQSAETLASNVENLYIANLTNQIQIDNANAMNKGILFTNKKNILENFGLLSLDNDSFEFKVENYNFDYLIDSEYVLKVNSTKNLYEYYNRDLEQNNFYELDHGFNNYSSLNFFNISNNFNSNFKEDTTHKNCLIYPNLMNNSVLQYSFNKNKDFTVSFYINPRRKNTKNFHYNPGCVLSIPGIISIFIVKGSNLDEEELTDGFRLYIQTGEDTYNALTNQDFDLSRLESQNNNLNYLSEDNLLKFNCWHNVVVSLKENMTQNESGYNLSLNVDGILKEIVFSNKDIEKSNSGSYILIGNKFNIQKNNNSDFVLHAFSKNNLALDDNEGPYVNKHIKLGSNIDYVLTSLPDPNNTYTLNNSLNASNSDYIDNNTSMALNAEICDIRVYNTFIDSQKSKDIFLNSVKDIENEIRDYGLVFYVPVFYRSQNVRKKGLINLNAPYQKTHETLELVSIGGGIAQSLVDVTNFVNIDENLTGVYEIDGEDENKWPQAEVDFRVKTHNISYDYPINPYFFNYTGGTEVSVEHFVRDFVGETQPNIIIGGSIKEDRYQDCFLVKPSNIIGENAKLLNKIAKSGGTADDLLEKIFSEEILDEQTINSLNVDFQDNNILYRNYMILPNDNGIQNQFYNNRIFKYKNNENVSVHLRKNKNIDYGFVSLNYLDKSALRTNIFNQNRLVVDEYLLHTQNTYESDSRRKLFYFENQEIQSFVLGASAQIQGKSSFPQSQTFIETSDKLKNISLSNYFNDLNVLYIHELDQDSINRLSFWRKNNTDGSIILDLSSASGLFNTMSNPCQRSYYSSMENSFSKTEVFDYKPLEEQNNIAYFKLNMPLWQTMPTVLENVSNYFYISKQLFNKKVKRETLNLKDVELPLTSGIRINLKDTRLGTIYRADSLTPHAKWNTLGNILYHEGIIRTCHVGLHNFGKTNFQINTKTTACLNVSEINLPAFAGGSNFSRNNSYISDLRIDESDFNKDEDFTYITDIDIHDENLNKVAVVKLSQPFAKKNSDNVLFRVKMDY